MSNSFNAREFIGITHEVFPPTKAEKIRKRNPCEGKLYPVPASGWDRARLFASGRIDVDGRGAIGVLPLRQEKISEKIEEKARQNYEEYVCSRWHYETGEIEVKVVPGYVSNRFISSLESQQPTEDPGETSKKYGAKGITPYGTRRVRQSASILERRFGKHLGLYTLTIPSLGKEATAHLSKQWSKLMNHYFIKMGRLYKRRGVEFHYVAVYEVQGRRLENRGEYALHTHYLAPSKVLNQNGKYEWIAGASDIRRVWEDVIRAELTCLPNDPRLTSAAVDATPVKTSAVAYLGKYMTKGSQECDRLIEMGLADCLPSQWWSNSKSLKQSCLLWEKKLSPEEIDEILYMCVNRKEYSAYFDYVSAVYANIGDREVCVGYSFKLARDNPLYDLERLRRNLDPALALLVK